MLLPRLSLLLTLLFSCITLQAQELKKAIKFSTFYAAVNGGNSVSDQTVYSVTNGLGTEVVSTPYDYSLTMGIRKIARFGYENRAQTFYDGTEASWSDGANIGKRNGLEFLTEVRYRRQQGREFLDQNHFLRYVGDQWMAKVEYLQDYLASIADGVNIMGNGREITYGEGLCEYKHSFADGIYIREMRMKQGQIGFSAIHKHTYAFFLLTGVLASSKEDGVEEFVAPCYIISPQGAKRIVYAVEDCIITTVHANPTNTHMLFFY